MKRVFELAHLAFYLFCWQELSPIVNDAVLIEEWLMVEKLVVKTGLSWPIRSVNILILLIGLILHPSLRPERLSPGIKDEMTFLQVN